ncbi:MAG: response regulator [Planctomycetes bacterium]|nr:response regulator [Planctomycetota bacterium]
MTTPAQRHLPTIVYVEDNAGEAGLFKEALRDGDHAVELLVFATGDQALAYFRAWENPSELPLPYCILLDSQLPVVAGSQLLRFIRGSRVFDATPVYIFAPETDYRDLIQAGIVSIESFITKSRDWDGFVQLADLLMRSVSAQQDATPACATDSKPEVHAEGALRRQDTAAQRAHPSMRR